MNRRVKKERMLLRAAAAVKRANHVIYACACDCGRDTTLQEFMLLEDATAVRRSPCDEP